MRVRPLHIIISWFLVATAGCSDAPTSPSIPSDSEASLSGMYPLNPGEGECDPWLDANWCEDDGGQCMTSTPRQPAGGDFTTLSSCPPGGDPGGGDPRGGSGGDSGGTSGTDPSKQLEDDASAACPPCDDGPPTAAEAQIMESLLDEVQCTDGRSTLSQMLHDGSLRVYTQGNTLYGVWNSETQQIYINWPKHVDSTGALDTHELADTMVHEAVHKLLGHVNGEPSTETHGDEFRNKMASCGFPQP